MRAKLGNAMMADAVGRLDAYAHVWDGSEPGWTIRISYREVHQVTAVFAGERVTAVELATLRRLVPALAAQPISELIARAAGQPRLAIGEFSADEAQRLEEAATAEGMRFDTTARTEVACLPLNTVTSMALLIEDSQLAFRVASEARARGVPIVEAYED